MKKYDHVIILNNEEEKGKLLPPPRKDIQSYPAQKTKQESRILCVEMQKQNKAWE